MGDEAQPRTSGMSVTRGMGDDTGAHGIADVAAPVVDTDDTLSATDPPRDPQAGRYSSPRLPIDPTSPDLAWGDGDVATAATPCMDIGAVATSSVTATRKRKGRSKQPHVAQDARKRQRVAALLLDTQDNTETGT